MSLTRAVRVACSAIAFRFVSADRLPQLPYQTLLDKYNTFSFLVLACTLVEHAVVGLWPDNETARLVDKSFGSFLFSLWVVANLFCLWRVKRWVHHLNTFLPPKWVLRPRLPAAQAGSFGLFTKHGI